ncbi:MAG: chemotaxis protein CheA [Candidatus Aureabacteria bacterium]|nr:chemotaxis protein CheA [Candidatus Auribacterota bacterium]
MTSESDELKEIVNDFIVESEEIIEKLDQKMLSLEKDSSSDTLNQVFRGFHTIKGTSGFLGFQKVSNLTHLSENVLNVLRRGEMSVTPEIVDILLEALDVLRLLVSNIKEEGQESSPENLPHVLEQLKKFQPAEKKEAPAAPEKTAEQAVPAVPAPEQEKIIEAPAAKMEEKVPDEEEKKLGEILIQEGLVTEEDIQDALKEQEQGQKLGEIFIRRGIISREQLESTLKKQKPKPGKIDQTIRVEVSRLDNLMNLVGELVLGRNRLSQVCKKIEGACYDDRSIDDLNETIAQLGMISGDLQESIMKTRMLPIQRVIGKFSRIIRSLQKSTKKEFDLKISGEDTELDKSIIEEIGDPLVHLIRNAVDHGIEYPEKRIAAGKPSKGTIHLKAFHEGHNIIIEIKDDGKGIETDKVREKAIKKNLVTRQKADLMSKSEILNFIFYPGFSTADIVTEISGRGVGLDVVKQNITRLKGIIEIDTELDRGTVFRIKLPLTLAIIQALVIEVGEEIFAIPLSSVVETVRILPSEIYEVEGKNIINLRGTIIPLIDLKKSFGISGRDTCKTDETGRVYIVIIGVAEKRKGLIVEKMLGQQEIVIKSLGKYLRGIPGFSGCTIMGDGKITLIVDIEKFFEDSVPVAANQTIEIR